MLGSVVAGLAGLMTGAVLTWFFGVRLNQAARRKEMRQKWALLGGAAQQLRTPLNDVLGLVQTLASRAADLPEDTRALVETIAGAGATVKAVLLDVFDILDFDAGEARIDRAVAPFPEIAEFIERTNRDRARRLGVTLSIDIKSSARASFLMDSLRVRQCVGAMVRQCVLQTPGGTVSLVAEAEDPKRGAKHRRLVVTVRDTSPGLPQEEAERYFMVSDFAKNRALMNSGASPLSLIVARLFAREMRGDLRVKSAPGRGVAFTLTTPVKRARLHRGDGPIASVSPFDAASLLVRERTILVAEDNTVNLQVLQAHLARLMPKAVLIAPNGAEALAILQKQRCDVILMDIRMPVMDGLVATKKIRASDASWRNTPIIAVSAAAAGSDREACRRAGMNAFVAKPVSPEDLYETLARVCAASGQTK